MIIAQYFVEFIFYSFLGWIWESIYCTVKEKKWADRGFFRFAARVADLFNNVGL